MSVSTGPVSTGVLVSKDFKEKTKESIYKGAGYHKKIKTIEQQVNEEQVQENRDRYLELSQELLRGFKIVDKHSLD